MARWTPINYRPGLKLGIVPPWMSAGNTPLRGSQPHETISRFDPKCLCIESNKLSKEEMNMTRV